MRKQKGFIRRSSADIVDMFRDADRVTREEIGAELIRSGDVLTIERLVPLLSEREPGVRMSLLAMMKRAGNLVWQPIICLLTNTDKELRLYACEVLGAMGDSRAIPYLGARIFDEGEDENVKVAAASALGNFGEESALSLLMKSLRVGGWTAFAAVQSLGRFRDPRAIGPLLEVLKQGDHEVRLAACRVLLDYRTKRASREIVCCLEKWPAPETYPILGVIVEHGDEYLLRLVKEKAGKKLFAYIVGALERQGVSIRLLHALALCATPDACAVMLSTLKRLDPDADEYDEAVHLFSGLNHIWKQRIEEYLAGEDAVPPMMSAMSRVGLKVSDRILLRAFQSGGLEARRAIVRALPSVARRGGRSIVKIAIDDCDSHVKGEAARAASALGMDGLHESVERLARESYFDIRVKATQALIRLRYGNAVKMLTEFVRTGSLEDGKVFLAVAPELTPDENLPLIKALLKKGSGKMRDGAIGIINLFLDRKAYMNLFTELMREKDISHAALKVIGERKLKRFRRRLLVLLRDPDAALWTKYFALSALAGFRDQSLFRVFARSLRADNSLLKIGALKALADLRDSRAAPLLFPLLHEKDEDVRGAAEAALKRIPVKEGRL